MSISTAAGLPYEAVIALDPRRHRDIGFDPRRGIRTFAAKLNWAPVVAGEFGFAAAYYPILFDSLDSGGGSIVLLGRTDGHNPWVTPDGQWCAGAYIPERFRCYPLVPGESDDGPIGIDEIAMLADPAEGMPLFNASGKVAAPARRFFETLDRHMRGRSATCRLQAWLVELDLLVPLELQVASRDGWCYRLAEFHVVDPDRLRQLPEATRARLQREGARAAIDAHLRSLDNLERLAPPRDALAESLAAGDPSAVVAGSSDPGPIAMGERRSAATRAPEPDSAIDQTTNGPEIYR